MKVSLCVKVCLSATGCRRTSLSSTVSTQVPHQQNKAAKPAIPLAEVFQGSTWQLWRHSEENKSTKQKTSLLLLLRQPSVPPKTRKKTERQLRTCLIVTLSFEPKHLRFRASSPQGSVQELGDRRVEPSLTKVKKTVTCVQTFPLIHGVCEKHKLLFIYTPLSTPPSCNRKEITNYP